MKTVLFALCCFSFILFTDACMPRDPASCADNQLCLAVGATGQFECVDLIPEGGECGLRADAIEDAVERIGDLRSDFEDRDILSELSDFVLPCAAGLVCRREGLESGVCRPEDTTGPCSRARAAGQDVDCDEDGNFEPLQCRRTDTSGVFRCACREPEGEVVPGTEVEVEDREDAPDCDDEVFERCTYESALGVSFEARHGERFVDPETCSLCLCDDGEAEFCVPANRNLCNRLNPGPAQDRTCRLEGETLEDDETVQVGCNLCSCRNGRLSCTRRDCEDDEDEDRLPPAARNCIRCARMRAEPVCGNDGRTYRSECYAVNCVGLDPEDVSPGPCSRRNVCEQLPCDVGEFCLRMGGVTCLSRMGCDRTRFRRCINPEMLTCEIEDDEEEEEEEEEEETTAESGSGEDSSSVSFGDEDEDDDVCGDDGRTYSSICRLLQNSGQIQVAHAGSCNRTDCFGGVVCGTDGTTYTSVCVLRSLSANARVDYRGECIDSDGEVAQDICALVRESGRCADLTDCETVIAPDDGCCPICGGGVTIGLDRVGLDDYIELNPSVDTVDELLKRILASGIIPEDVIASCLIEAGLLDSGELHLLLENKMFADSTCFEAVQALADLINNPPSSDSSTGKRSVRATSTSGLPQALQFATVASTAPLEDNGTNGAVAFVPSAALLLLVTIAGFLM